MERPLDLAAPPDAPLLSRVAEIVASSDDLGSLVRPLLDVLAQVTGLETTYLTVYDRHDDTQIWRFVHNSGDIEFPDGGAFPWGETLCARLIERGENTIQDLGAEDPDHPAHALLGIRGYVSIPYSLVGRDGEVAGTLCAGSLAPLDDDSRTLATFKMFATLIADRLGREVDLGRERVRADAAERAQAERARLVASAGHSLKGPLSVVIGWAETLRDRYDELEEERRREGIDRIARNATSLRERLEDVIDEARTTVLTGDLHPGPVELHTAIGVIVDDFDGANPSLDFTLEPTDAVAVVDRTALELTLTHLFENAVKYVPAGGSVHVTATATAGRVTVVVDDDGPGLPADLDVFAPFQRGLEEPESGTGLGLHIVRTLVEASEGSVQAGSNDKGGARFTIELPAAS